MPTVGIYSQDTGMEFCIRKCAILITRSRKQQMTEGRKNQNAPRKGNLQILGNIRSRHH